MAKAGMLTPGQVILLRYLKQIEEPCPKLQEYSRAVQAVLNNTKETRLPDIPAALISAPTV
jgi:hypothetical protein